MLWDSEPSTNQTGLYLASFTLQGIPGLEEHHSWIAATFGLMYLVALLSNFFLLFLIMTERGLRRQPMFLLLAMLAVADLVLSSSTVPKTLAVLLSASREISFGGCLAQMFFTHLSFIAESTVLLAMAFDRYVAICHPLRYAAILAPSAVAKVGLAAVARGFCVMLPTVFLLRRLPYCGWRQRVMPHSYCEHMGVARMACADIAVNIWYGFTTTLLSPGVDSLLIGLSYVLILRSVFRLPAGEAPDQGPGHLRLPPLRHPSLLCPGLLLLLRPPLWPRPHPPAPPSPPGQPLPAPPTHAQPNRLCREDQAHPAVGGPGVGAGGQVALLSPRALPPTYKVKTCCCCC